MSFLTDHVLSLLVLLPVVGAVAIALCRREAEALQKWIGLAVSTAVFVLSLHLVDRFELGPGMQFVERHAWLPAYGISYHLGVDGLSLWLIILTTLLTPLCLLGSWSSIHERVREFGVFMLLLEAGMIGVFVSLDLFLFYIFWEAMLIPMYFLIGIWGHDRRIYAAVKFFLYTMAGSVLMLVAFLVLYRVSGRTSFDIEALAAKPIDPLLQTWLFLACALAFAIKVPMWPFHTWLPDAHVEAPTAGSVILAAVLLKMGGYGFLRIAIPLFPDAAFRFAPLIGWLAVIGIVYGALVSLVQPDLKKLVAYSSVSHLGFVMLGIAAFTTTSVVGAVYQMLNHGISTGALFFMVGMLYDRRHTRAISEFGGLKTVMPWFSALFLLICLSSIAVPGLNGFVGEFLILIGSWPFDRTMVVVATLGVILSAGIHPLDGEARPLRRGHEREEPRPSRPLAPRARRDRPPLRPRHLHGRGEPHVHAQDRALRGQPDPRGSAPPSLGRAGRDRDPAPAPSAPGAAPMTSILDLRPAIPAAIVAFTGLVTLLAQAFTPKGKEAPSAALSLAGLLGALVSVVLLAGGPGRGAVMADMLAADDFSLFFHALILGIGILAVLLSGTHLREIGAERGEYYALLLFSMVGMLGLVSAKDLIAVFIALEIMSVSLYAMAGMRRDREESQEAALKYFITGAFSSSFLLYGIALLYGATGSTLLDKIGPVVATLGPGQGRLVIIGVGLLLVGFGFKVALVPFHMWTPDVYEGAPTTVTAFMSAGVKAAAFGALLRVFGETLTPLAASWQPPGGGARPGHDGGGQPGGSGADQRQEDARLLLRGPRRLHPRRPRGRAPDRDPGGALLPSGLCRREPGGLRRPRVDGQGGEGAPVPRRPRRPGRATSRAGGRPHRVPHLADRGAGLRGLRGQVLPVRRRGRGGIHPRRRSGRRHERGLRLLLPARGGRHVHARARGWRLLARAQPRGVPSPGGIGGGGAGPRHLSRSRSRDGPPGRAVAPLEPRAFGRELPTGAQEGSEGPSFSPMLRFFESLSPPGR